MTNNPVSVPVRTMDDAGRTSPPPLPPRRSKSSAPSSTSPRRPAMEPAADDLCGQVSKPAGNDFISTSDIYTPPPPPPPPIPRRLPLSPTSQTVETTSPATNDDCSRRRDWSASLLSHRPPPPIVSSSDFSSSSSPCRRTASADCGDFRSLTEIVEQHQRPPPPPPPLPPTVVPRCRRPNETMPTPTVVITDEEQASIAFPPTDDFLVDVAELVFKTGVGGSSGSGCCASRRCCCCSAAAVGPSAIVNNDAKLTIVTTWRGRTPRRSRTKADRASTSDARCPTVDVRDTCTDWSRRFLVPVSVPLASSPGRPLSSSALPSSSSSFDQSASRSDVATIVRLDATTPPSGSGASDDERRRPQKQQRRVNEYVDDPLSTSSSAVRQHHQPIGETRQESQMAAAAATAAQRFFILISSPSIASRMIAASTGSHVMSMTSPFPSETGPPPPPPPPTSVEEHQPVWVTTPTTSVVVQMSTPPVLEGVVKETGTCCRERIDGGAIGAGVVDPDELSTSSSTCCCCYCGKSSGDTVANPSVRARGAPSTPAGCRSLVAALCQPGLWLVRQAKASYRRRQRRMTTGLDCDSPRVTTLHCSDELTLADETAASSAAMATAGDKRRASVDCFTASIA